MKSKFTFMWARITRKHLHMAINLAILLLRDVCLISRFAGFG